MIRKIKNLLKNFDYFAVKINFNYKEKTRFQTATDGLIFLIVMLSLFIYICLNLSNFINRKNLSIIYYDSQLNGTDIINFEDYNLSFSFGLECQNYQKFYSNLDEIYNIFYFSLKFVRVKRNKNVFIKTKDSINFHKCNKSDFYNNFNEKLDYFGLKSYFCPDKKSELINGFYGHENFFYYEITISAKYNNFSLYNEIFTDGDCKFSIYYTDFSINIKNFSQPFSYQINQKFSQLTPVEFQKKDIFFILNEFESHENLLLHYNKPTFCVSFSKEKDFANYKGKDRFETKIEDYEKFGRFFLRADTKRIEIVRKYMKLKEFLAEMMSLFSGILFILNILVGLLNNYYCYNSIMQNIFLFKSEQDFQLKRMNNISHKKICLSSEENFNNDDDDDVEQKHKKRVIKKMKILYNQTKILTTKLNQNFIKETNDNDDDDDKETQNVNLKRKNKNKSLKKKTTLNFQNNTFGFEFNKNQNSNNSVNSSFEDKKNKSFAINNNSSNNNFVVRKSLSLFKINKTERPEILINNLTTMKINNFNLNNNNNFFYNTSFKRYKKFNVLDAKITKKKNNFSANVIPNLHLNLMEIMITLFCPFLISKKLKKKNLLLKNEKKKFFENLDILTYLKNLQQIQVLNYILFEKYQINLIEFISKPCISLVNEYSNNNNIKKKDENLEIEKFFEYYKILIKKKNKNNFEIKLNEIIENEIKNLLE